MAQVTTAFSGEEISVHHALPINIKIEDLDKEITETETPIEQNSFLMTPMVLYEADQKYLVYVYIDDCVLDDLDVTVKNQLLQIKCRKKEDCRNTNSSGWFCWCSNMNLGILLPQDAYTGHIQACHSNGLLKISIDKI